MNKNILNDRLLAINGKIRAHEAKVLKQKKVDITQREFDYLGVIMSIKSPKMTVLVDHMGVTKGTFSNTVKKMVIKGYLKFISVKDDKRARIIEATPKGLRAIEIRNQIRAAYYDKIVGVIGKDNVADLLESMNKIIEVL